MNSAPLGLVDVFLAGMIFSYISIHAIYILALIPIPFQKTQSFEERWREVKKHAQLLRSKYSNAQLRKTQSLLILLLLGGLLLANLIFQILPKHLAVNTLVVIIPQIIPKQFTISYAKTEKIA